MINPFTAWTRARILKCEVIKPWTASPITPLGKSGLAIPFGEGRSRRVVPASTTDVCEGSALAGSGGYWKGAGSRPRLLSRISVAMAFQNNRGPTSLVPACTVLPSMTAAPNGCNTTVPIWIGSAAM